MSIADEISRLQGAKASLKTAIEGKGVTVPSATKLDGYAALVEGISTGWAGLRAEVGSFIPDTTIGWVDAQNYAIPHTLGAVPGFIFVWTHDYDDDFDAGEKPSGSNLADFWIDKDGLLPFYQKADSGDDDSLPYGGFLDIATAKRVQFRNPTHLGTTAMIHKPTASVFYPPAMHNFATYRAGVTYNYFIAEKGW